MSDNYWERCENSWCFRSKSGCVLQRAADEDDSLTAWCWTHNCQFSSNRCSLLCFSAAALETSQISVQFHQDFWYFAPCTSAFLSLCAPFLPPQLHTWCSRTFIGRLQKEPFCTDVLTCQRCLSLTNTSCSPVLLSHTRRFGNRFAQWLQQDKRIVSLQSYIHNGHCFYPGHLQPSCPAERHGIPNASRSCLVGVGIYLVLFDPRWPHPTSARMRL